MPPSISAKERKASCRDARAKIFDAATKEFAVNGLAGARTDAIARAAGVNIALLFYYFKNKEGLYAAVLEDVFSRWAQAVLPPLTSSEPPRERIIGYVEAFYDFVAGSVWRPRLVQLELMRSMRTRSPYIRKLLERHVNPIRAMVVALIEEGIASGEFRPVDVENFIHSIVGMVVHYFSTGSTIVEISGEDPLSPARVRARRIAVLDIVATALFTSGLSAKAESKSENSESKLKRQSK